MTVSAASVDRNKHWWALLKAWIWNCSSTLSSDGSFGRKKYLSLLSPLFSSSCSKTEFKQIVPCVISKSMENAFGFKNTRFGTQKEMMQCYIPIYNPPQNIKMIPYVDANRTFASTSETQFSVTSLSTDLSITKGDALTSIRNERIRIFFSTSAFSCGSRRKHASVHLSHTTTMLKGICNSQVRRDCFLLW